MTKEEQMALFQIAGTLAHLRAPLGKIDEVFTYCALCNKVRHQWRFLEAQDAGYHDPDCPWRLAIEFVFEIEGEHENSDIHSCSL